MTFLKAAWPDHLCRLLLLHVLKEDAATPTSTRDRRGRVMGGACCLELLGED